MIPMLNVFITDLLAGILHANRLLPTTSGIGSIGPNIANSNGRWI